MWNGRSASTKPKLFLNQTVRILDTQVFVDYFWYLSWIFSLNIDWNYNHFQIIANTFPLELIDWIITVLANFMAIKTKFTSELRARSRWVRMITTVSWNFFGFVHQMHGCQWICSYWMMTTMARQDDVVRGVVRMGAESIETDLKRVFWSKFCFMHHFTFLT